MSMRQLVGISLACLMTSACEIGKTAEESLSEHQREAASSSQGNEEAFTSKSPNFRWEVAHDGWSGEYSSQQVGRTETTADACGSIPDPCCSSLRATGITLFGKAAWYDLVGRQTASGEILDSVTATAAHRSLPLVSYANVTNLDNGRWVVVKINDRGPYTRGRILDLSPRAADALDMKRAGVVAVAVEPLVNQAAPTVAVFQTSGAAIAQ